MSSSNPNPTDYPAVVVLTGPIKNQNFTIQIDDTPGATWSVGDAAAGQATGVNITTSGSGMPLNTLASFSTSVINTNMVINTSFSGSDVVTITIQVYVKFTTPSQYITISVLGDHNVNSTFAFTGYAAKTLDSSGTIIAVPN